ncbi:MAG TPA: hypothetical protein VKY26_01570, partial [Actinomycetota bacterium]|nr:hypothetical protein [Actinomycetota bacterium]
MREMGGATSLPQAPVAAPGAERPAATGGLPAWRWRARRWAVPLGIFAASRAAVFAVVFFALRLPIARTPGWTPVDRFFGFWDGAYYLQIAKTGYPATLAPAPVGGVHAFFPLYPLAVRFLHAATGLSFLRAGVLINLAASGLAMVVIWELVQRLSDGLTASRAVTLICFFPWAFILSMAYPEGLMLLFASVCLLALLDKQWVLAGLAALAAGAARPDGFVLAFPCAWAALVAIRQQRSWRALAAPVLAPLGLLGFFLFLQRRTGDFWANLTARNRGWSFSGIGFHPHAALKVIHAYLANPSADLNRSGSIVTMLFIAVALVLMATWRPPAILWWYVLPVVVLALVFDTYASLPRFTLEAFPLLVA